jgi:hypothetical protein
MTKATARLFFPGLITVLLFSVIISCGDNKASKKGMAFLEKIDSVITWESSDLNNYGDNTINTLLILPRNPSPDKGFRILATGGRNIRKAKIIISGPTGSLKPLDSKNGEELPYWRIDNFAKSPEGTYTVNLMVDNKEVSSMVFEIAPITDITQKNSVWKTTHGWDSAMETIYSAWINALFQGCDEQNSWNALHEVTQNADRNFLFNYLSLGEDDPTAKIKVNMEPDCADNPFFLRAYFAWKLGLPFGCHVSDRGYLGRNPKTGEWMTNETSSSKKHPVQAFNTYLRSVMNWVHSGTARTALDNEKSDYYPVALNREALRPGTVYADPYGHTLIIISWVPQTKNHPGRLLAVDAQPDKTIAIKRFWQGNFLFNTSEVVGEPGFKAFRPISYENNKPRMMPNKVLTDSAGYAPFSLQQRKMESEDFYHTLERIINPKPLDPEEALLDLVQALHEQLLVRVKSVSNGEAYFQSHPGAIIPMPSNARGVFQALGQWEDFSTPNRDLRLLIAMDAVLDFPNRVNKYPTDYDLSKSSTPDEVKQQLQAILDEKGNELSVSYVRSDGSIQKLTLTDILNRKDAFEMAYNPNDGIEILWGAPENSEERSTCRRHAPGYQQKTMTSVRKWFTNRLHPPT